MTMSSSLFRLITAYIILGSSLRGCMSMEDIRFEREGYHVRPTDHCVASTVEGFDFQVEPIDGASLHWALSRNLEVISFLFQVNTMLPGFIAVGFSSDGYMIESDAVVGFPSQGTVIEYGLNSKASGINLPLPAQEITGVFVESSRGSTSLAFTRPITPAGHSKLALFPAYYSGSPNFLLWAFGQDESIGYHFQNRGSFTVELFCPITPGSPPRDAVPDSASSGGGDRVRVNAVPTPPPSDSGLPFLLGPQEERFTSMKDLAFTGMPTLSPSDELPAFSLRPTAASMSGAFTATPTSSPTSTPSKPAPFALKHGIRLLAHDGDGVDVDGVSPPLLRADGLSGDGRDWAGVGSRISGHVVVGGGAVFGLFAIVGFAVVMIR